MLAYAITTYNEETNISQCIESLLSAGVDRSKIYVVDSISSDRTVEIAQSAGVKVLTNRFTDMASQRNFAFAKIGEENSDFTYVCILDADEKISTAFHSELVTLLKQNQADSAGIAIAISRKMFFNNFWVKRASRYPVFIDRIGKIGATNWRNAGHGEFLEAERRLLLVSPLEERDRKGIESLLRRHTIYARNEARLPIVNGKQSKIKECILGMRGTYFFVFVYFLYLFIFRGIIFGERRERDYAVVKLMYEAQIVLFKRYE